jgi:hypothetical protein
MFRRAPDDRTVGLWNPTSCDPIWVRGDQVFRERFGAITDGNMSTVDFFHDEDFFSDISSLYINDMADDTDVNLDANVNQNKNLNENAPATPYAIFSYLFQFLLQFLVLAFRINVICISWLDAICSYILLVYIMKGHGCRLEGG